MSQLADVEAGAAIATRLADGASATRWGYCPGCGKAIVAVVAHEGSLWLYGPGGRVGSNGALIAEFEDEVRDYAGDDRPEAVYLFESFSRYAEEARASRQPAITPPAAQLLDEHAFRLGDISASVACRGCRCWREVILTQDLRLAVGDRVPPSPLL